MLTSFTARRRKFVPIPLLVALTAVAVLVAACGGSDESTDGAAATDELTKVRMVGPGLNLGAVYWTIYVAMDEGMFEERGIDFEHAATVSSGTLTLQALAAGEADFASATPDRFVIAMDEGARITMAGINQATVFQFFVKNEIADWEDLKGKPIAVASTEFTGGDGVLRLMLEAHGVNTTDLELLVAATSIDKLAAATKGAVAGTAVSEPSASALAELGTYKVLGESWSQENPKAFYPFQAVGFTKEFEEKNPEAVKDTMAALQEAQQWLLDPANKQRAIDLMIKYGESESDVAKRVYDIYMEQAKAFYDDIAVDDEKLRALLEAMGRPYSDKYSNSVAAPILAEMASETGQ